MLTLNEIPESLKKIYGSYKEKCRELFESISSYGEKVSLSKDKDIFSEFPESAALFVNNGFFKLFHDKTMVRIYSDGDFVTVNDVSSLDNRRLISEFGTEVTVFSKDALIEIVSDSPNLFSGYTSVLKYDSEINLRLCRVFKGEEITPDFIINSVESGTVILKEGNRAESIYEMVEGYADVFKDRTKVGEISSGEVFGEISFLTKSNRSATVKASSDCLIRRVKKDDFFELIKQHPAMMLSLSKQLADRIVRLNKKVIEKEIEVMI